MTPDETHAILQESVIYRCTCGNDVSLIVGVGGVCSKCGRRVSPKVLSNALAATMTISGPPHEHDASRLETVDNHDPGELVGRDYGHFRIVRPLGRGGAGYVYQALDTSLQRYVAVKVLRSNAPVSSKPDYETETETLLQEAVAQARVAHPNIVTIYYVGKEQGEPFLAMELVDGISLSERISRGNIAFSEISAIAENIVRALTFSFGMDIIHGDIKPSNILLPKTGGAKLSDFGMARRASDKAKLAKGGTPNYLAPELLHGGSPSRQSDMYSLGVTLYEMTFGRLPIELTGTSVVDWQGIHETSEVEFPAVWPEQLPPKWEKFLRKLLAKNPEDRYESYDRLSRALRDLSPHNNVVAQPLPRIIATLIDWMSVILLMQPFKLAMGMSGVESSPFWRSVFVFVDFIPIVGYTVLVFFWRQSIGRRLMQLRVINRFGMIPMGRKMVLRSLMRMIIPWMLAMMMVLMLVSGSWQEYVIGGMAALVLLFLVADTGALLFAPGRRSLHDMIFKTQVVIDSRF